MKTKRNTYNYLNGYLFNVRSSGGYSVTLTELKEEFNISDKAIQQNLYRLKTKHQIAQLRQGFYVIIPPEYSQKEMLPIYLFADDLMKFLNRDYYLSLFSAAALHSNGHLQPMEYQLITENPALRNIKNHKLNINFFTKSKWDSKDIIEKKTDAGFIKVSSPELTALDLVFYNKKIGGINRLLPILKNLSEEIRPSKLLAAAKRHNHTTTVQRLGFIFDKVLGIEMLSRPLLKLLQKRKCNIIPLSIAHKDKKGKIDETWEVIVNIELDY